MQALPTGPKSFLLDRSYHRTAAESYYGCTITCKGSTRFFLQCFDKVTSKRAKFGILTMKIAWG
jgi:hypothetical protein